MNRLRIDRLLWPLGIAIALLAIMLVSLSLVTGSVHAAPAQPVSFQPQTSISHIALQPFDRARARPDDQIQATEQLSISNIVGATYNPDRGEMIILGIADPDLPPMDMTYIHDNLLIALRAFYAPDALEIPGVSIEGVDDPLTVVYFGTVTNTHFGQVCFESDRLLKTYTMGRDNLTGLSVTSNVTGYQSYPDRYSQLEETESDPITIRYFFTPTLRIEEIPEPHTILFSRTHNLIDWAYIGSASSAASAQAAQGFVDNFNQYYWAYAAERQAVYNDSTLYELAQLSKLTAIAKWAYDEGLELELPGFNSPWLDNFPVSFSATVTQTPGISVTWVQTRSGIPYEMSLRGGVYAIGEEMILLEPTEAGKYLAHATHDALEPPMPGSIFPILLVNQTRPMDLADSHGPMMAYVIALADNALINGDFEDGPGSAPWQQDSHFDMITSGSPHSGQYGAQFPTYHNAYVTMSQTLYIPADATRARLTYWRAVATNETTHPYDFFRSWLADSVGDQLIHFESLDDGDADGYWHQVSFDVGAYAGQTVQLWFTATTDGSAITNFFVDDISLDYLDPTPPTVTRVQASTLITETGDVEFVVVFHEQMNTAVLPVVTIHVPGDSTVYTLTAKTGPGYTQGYLNSNPKRWYGSYSFDTSLPDGTYVLDIASAQDLAENVIYPAIGRHILVVDLIRATEYHAYLPLVVK